MNIPTFGIGTDFIPDGECAINEITWAIEAGYRLIDNADCYKNESGVGIAIKKCIENRLVTREDLFVINKVPDWKQGYDSTIKCCKNSLKLTGLDYFDLYLVHSPYRQNENWQQSVLDTYRALETLYKEGLVKAIGVSNFELRHLKFLLEEAEIKPFANEIEFHPQHQQRHVVKFCQENNIIVIGWGTLNQGRIFKNETLKELAKKYQKDIAQIAMRYSIQKGVIPLVRSSKKERIELNSKICDFTISSEDMLLLDSLDGGEFSNTHYDGIKPIKMIPESQVRNNAVEPYNRSYKLFGFIPLLKKIKESKRISRIYLLNIPILKIDTKPYIK